MQKKKKKVTAFKGLLVMTLTEEKTKEGIFGWIKITGPWTQEFWFVTEQSFFLNYSIHASPAALPV